MGNKNFVPSVVPQDVILWSWEIFSHAPTETKKIKLCRKTTRPLGSDEQWSLNGSLDCNTKSQQELFRKRERKWDKIPYVQAFILLHQS